MKKYKKVNMPLEAYNLLKEKKINMERYIKEITGKRKAIPMTSLMTGIMKRTQFFNDDEIKKIAKKRKIR